MQRVFEIFEEILSIPRSSGKEEKIASYIVEFAKTHNLKYKKDEYNNVFIKKNNNKLVLSMTIRGAFSDIFWFTLFHEIGHLLLHGKKDIFLENIEYDDKVFNKYNMDEIDALRNEKMGYIFQNYLLINNFTVYDNLKVALEAINVIDPLEQNKRIEYALKSVGLFKYRKKKVKNLSGGQMQRVSIARCIVKNSEVIIADEPTGNIDSENTIQIMNILKKLSETKLVILVTHEIHIARYYSDRIIQIKDGKIISDGLVADNGKLSTQTDRKIYLGDLNKDNTSTNKINFELYVDEKSTESDLIIAVRNDTIYIKSSKKIVNVSESSIELVDEKYHDPVNVVKNFEFDTSWYKNPSQVDKRSLFKTNFINGFKEFKNQGKSKVVFIIINILLGIFIGSCFINLSKFAYIDQTGITDDNLGQVVTNISTTYNELSPINDKDVYMSIFEEGLIEEIIPFAYQSYYLEFKENFIFSERQEFNYWKYPYQDDIKIIYGNRPVNNQMLAGKLLADKIIEAYGYDKGDYNKIIGISFDGCVISGVVDKQTMTAYYNPVIMYLDNSDYTRGDVYSIGSYQYYTDTYELLSGTNPINSNEVIIDQVFADKINANVSETIMLGSKQYKIVGIFNQGKVVDLPSVLSLDKEICGLIININNFSLSKPSYKYLIKYLHESEYEIVLGKKVSASDECIVHVDSNLEIGQSIFGYKIVGIYNKSYDSGSLGNNYMYDNIVITDGFSIINEKNLVYKFSDEAPEYFKNNKLKVYDLDDYQRHAIRKHHMEENIAILIVSLFFIGASIMLTFLTNRSRLINEIKTIGVYRSIGKSRKCLLYQKFGYNLLMTSVSTVIGYSIAWIVSELFKNITKDLQTVVPINPLILILGLIILYIIGIFIGTAPTRNLIKKTPAEINSKYDI